MSHTATMHEIYEALYQSDQHTSRQTHTLPSARMLSLWVRRALSRALSALGPRGCAGGRNACGGGRDDVGGAGFCAAASGSALPVCVGAHGE